MRFACTDGSVATVVGTIPLPVVGERLAITGRWSSHASYGRQFEAEFLERLMPDTAAEILRYLSGRAVKGVGPKTAARLVERFGDQTLRVMECEPLRMAEVAGISRAKAQAIGEEFRLRAGVRRLMEFFSMHGLPTELAVKTYKLYGEAATEMLYDDPYLLTEDGLEAPFGAVDRFAVELGVAGDDPRRVEAGLLFELKYNLSCGHCFLPEEKLAAATQQLLSVEAPAVRAALARLTEAERLTRAALAGIAVVYLPELYEAERCCAQRLPEFAAATYPAPHDMERLLALVQEHGGVRYSQQQEQAIREAAQSGLLLITGGPGTGKTTILKGVLALYDRMGLSCVLAAPTGRAAKRLSEVTGAAASTIHRLLEAGVDPHTGKLFFARGEDNPLKADAVIVDEMSMVDVQLLASLLRAIPGRARLILVGDPDQLPPVGAGFPFGDMLRSETLPTVRLTEIFRQAQQSLIVMNAHAVNRGQMPELHDRRHDCFFLPCRSEQEVCDTVTALCKTRLPKNMGIPPEQIQVLSPTRKGATGTENLNRLLQAALNPPSQEKKERTFGQTVFREGDRVMQIRNNYDIIWKSTDGGSSGGGIFNGDIGIAAQIDTDAETLRVVFDDREADYDFTQLGELERAYAMTVHKSQGSEYHAVILCAWGGSPYLLNRSVLYTALTRARELLIIVGREQTIAEMTRNAKVGRRYTGLKLRLQGKA